MRTLPALSFWQPYAWLIVSGIAEVDSRRWSPPEKYIGQRIAIHASQKKVTKAEFQEFLGMMKDLGIKNYPSSPDEFTYGAIVGSVEIDSVSQKSKSDWAVPGYFHWVLKNPRQMSPLKIKGRMGWFRVELPTSSKSSS